MIVYYKNMIASRHLWERERQRGKKFKKLFCDFVNSTDALGLSVLTLAFWYSSPSCMGPRGSFLFPAPYKSKQWYNGYDYDKVIISIDGEAMIKGLRMVKPLLSKSRVSWVHPKVIPISLEEVGYQPGSFDYSNAPGRNVRVKRASLSINIMTSDTSGVIFFLDATPMLLIIRGGVAIEIERRIRLWKFPFFLREREAGRASRERERAGERELERERERERET